MDTDGIGIHHKITARITTSQRKQSEFLLDKAKDQPQYHTNHRTYQWNHTPLEQEYTRDQLVAGPKLRNVTTSAFLSIISMDKEPITLKQAIIGIKVRKI